MQIKQKKGFYYLIHTYRDDGVKNFEKYIGKTKPSPQDEENFIYEYVNHRWLKEINELQTIYASKKKTTSDLLQKKNLRSFGVRFTHNTNKIEGSTLSKGDTRMILEDGIIPANSNVNDVIETKAHMQVYEQMVSNQETLSFGLILKYHKQIFQLTEPNHAGSFRNGPVTIGGSDYIPPPSRFEVDLMFRDLMEWYFSKKKLYNPVFLAAIFHLRFVSIHPFEDGNGRITRLLTNYILYWEDFPLYDLDAKYRKAYYNALERSNIKNNEMHFISWFFPRYITYIKKTMTSLGYLT